MTIKDLDFRVESMWMKPELFGITLLYTVKPFRMGWNRNHQWIHSKQEYVRYVVPRSGVVFQSYLKDGDIPHPFTFVAIQGSYKT
jgi:hypothetical protein